MSKAKPTRRIRPGGNGRRRNDSLGRTGTPDLIAALYDESSSHDISAVQEMCERVALGIGCTLNHKGNRSQPLQSTGLTTGSSITNAHSQRNQFDEDMCDHHSLDDCSEIDYTDDSGEDEDYDEGDDSEEDYDSEDYDSGEDEADDVDYSEHSNEVSDENYSEEFGDTLAEDEGDRFRSRIAACATQLDAMYDESSIVSQKFHPHKYSCHHGCQKHPRIRPRDEPFVEVQPCSSVSIVRAQALSELNAMMAKVCPECGKGGHLLVCSRCRLISYCGVQCQRKSWPKHRIFCLQDNLFGQDAPNGDSSISHVKSTDVCKSALLLQKVGAAGDVSIAKELVEQGRISVATGRTLQGWTLLHASTYYANENLLDWVLSVEESKPVNYSMSKQSSGLDVNLTAAKGETALHIACATCSAYRNGSQILHRILKCRDVLVNARNSRTQRTPLMSAVSNGAIDAVQILLSNESCQINATDNRDQTALHIAISEGHTAIVRELITNRRCSPFILDYLGRNVLHIAALEGRSAPLRCLLDYRVLMGVLACAKDIDGNTPLHLAAASGTSSCIEDLIRFDGVDLVAENLSGQIPCDIAETYGHESIASFLRQAWMSEAALAVAAKRHSSRWLPKSNFKAHLKGKGLANGAKKDTSFHLHSHDESALIEHNEKNIGLNLCAEFYEEFKKSRNISQWLPLKFRGHKETMAENRESSCVGSSDVRLVYSDTERKNLEDDKVNSESNKGKGTREGVRRRRAEQKKRRKERMKAEKQDGCLEDGS